MRPVLLLDQLLARQGNRDPDNDDSDLGEELANGVHWLRLVDVHGVLLGRGGRIVIGGRVRGNFRYFHHIQ